MAAKGKHLETHLMDGDENGRWCVRLPHTWTGIGYKIGHEDIRKSKDIDELHQPGVYFLFGRNDDEEYDYVYVGEGEDVIKRIPEGHSFDGEDIYWREAVIFVEDGLDKAHIKYLEHRFYHIIKDAGRYKVINKKEPEKSKVSKPVEDSLETFIDNARTVMVALTYKVFIPLPVPGSKAKLIDDIFTYTFPDGQHKATGGFYEGQFWVLKGSYFSDEAADYISKGVIKLREEYAGKLDSKHQIKEDVPFGKTSSALSFVTGKSISGRDAWKNKDGLSLNELEGTAPSTGSASPSPGIQFDAGREYEVIGQLDVDGQTRLHLAGKRLKAYAYMLEKGLLVEKGSQIKETASSTVTTNEIELREHLVNNGLVKDWVFTQNVLFHKPTKASDCICGRRVNKNDVWLDENGTKYGDL